MAKELSLMGQLRKEADRDFSKYLKYVNEIFEENKKLNIKVASLEGEIKGLNSVIDKLKEENQTLELWLDNKEKVNKNLREKLNKAGLEEYGFFNEY